MVLLCNALMQLQLGSCVQFWVPPYQKDLKLLDCVWRRQPRWCKVSRARGASQVAWFAQLREDWAVTSWHLPQWRSRGGAGADLWRPVRGHEMERHCIRVNSHRALWKGSSLRGWSATVTGSPGVPAPSLSELKEYLDNTLDHMFQVVVWGAKSWTQWTLRVTSNLRHSKILKLQWTEMWSKNITMNRVLPGFTIMPSPLRVHYNNIRQGYKLDAVKNTRSSCTRGVRGSTPCTLTPAALRR